MARGINKVILIGNVGSTEFKNNITKVSLATSDSYKDKVTGENITKTDWHRLTFFGKLAEITNQYVTKGDKLYIEGQIKYGKYVDRDGIERYSTDIIVRNMEMLGSKKDPDAIQSVHGRAYPDSKPPHPATDQNNYSQTNDGSDDIPF